MMVGLWQRRFAVTWVAILVVCGGAHQASSQQTPTLEFPAGTEVLDGFFAPLHRLEAGESVRVRVGWFGDSHTAGESWPGKFRERLVQRFRSGGRGLVFPGKPQRYHLVLGAKTGQSDGWESGNVLYAASDRKKSLAGWGLFGLSGYSLCTRKAGSEVWLEMPDETAATQAQVYFARLPEPGVLAVQAGNQAPVQIETMWSSATLGVQGFAFAPGEPRRVVIRAVSGAVCVLGMALENEQPGVVVDGMGVNGARLTTFGRLTDYLLQAMTQHRPYDLVVLAYGTNEASDGEFDAKRYEEAAHKAMQVFRWAMPQTACLMVGAPAFGSRHHGAVVPNPNVQALRQIQVRLAATYRCAYLDLHAAMGGDAAVAEWLSNGPKVVERLQRQYDLKLDATLVEKARKGDLPLLSKDLIHMHTAGYHLLAEIMIEALMGAYEGYLARVGE